jgi:purine-binding chemotaxis protein CheW
MEHQLFIVGYRKAHYAIDASTVQEAVWRPALSPIEEMPPFISGVFSLRGVVVPVIDLGRRFGYGDEPVSSQDRIVVIAEGAHRVGIVVHALHDVVTVHDDAVEPVGNFQLPGGQSRFLRGLVKQDDGLLMLLDGAALLNEAIALEPFDPPPVADDREIAGDADIDLFRERARELARVAHRQDDDAHAPYALIRLGGERFGVRVGDVREFVHLNGLTPVPLAPAHVAGQVNLRGEILVVVDIRPLLGVSMAAPAMEIVVVRADDMPFGILAEAIDDIRDVSAADRVPAPSNGRPGSTAACPTVATFDGGFASLIDIAHVMVALTSRPHSPTPNTPQHPESGGPP